MARKKVKLAFIENEKARRVTYKKRVNNLVKKTHELSVMCGVEACAIIYRPDDKVPVTWPSTEEEVKKIISNFERSPDIDQYQRQLNQQTFLQQCLSKAVDKLVIQKRRHKEIEIDNLISDLMANKLTLEQVPPTVHGDLISAIDDKLLLVNNRINVLGEASTSANINQNANDVVGNDEGNDDGLNGHVEGHNHHSK